MLKGRFNSTAPVLSIMALTRDLLQKCQAGDDSSWRELFYSTYPLSKWVVVHTLFNIPQDIVDEISQDAMIALAANINEINDEAHLKRFVKRVTHNKCIDYIRKNKELFEELYNEIPEQKDLDLEDYVVDALHEAVQDLKEPCKTIVRGRYLLNMSYKDISKKIGVDTGQIGVRLNRCLSFLKNLLEYKKISWEDVI